MRIYTKSKFGYKVIVLEKHYQIGGCLQTFRRNGGYLRYRNALHWETWTKVKITKFQLPKFIGYG